MLWAESVITVILPGESTRSKRFHQRKYWGMSGWFLRLCYIMNDIAKILRSRRYLAMISLQIISSCNFYSGLCALADALKTFYQPSGALDSSCSRGYMLIFPPFLWLLIVISPTDDLFYSRSEQYGLDIHQYFSRRRRTIPLTCSNCAV